MRDSRPARPRGRRKKSRARRECWTVGWRSEVGSRVWGKGRDWVGKWMAAGEGTEAECDGRNDPGPPSLSGPTDGWYERRLHKRHPQHTRITAPLIYILFTRRHLGRWSSWPFDVSRSSFTVLQPSRPRQDRGHNSPISSSGTASTERRKIAGRGKGDIVYKERGPARLTSFDNAVNAIRLCEPSPTNRPRHRSPPRPRTP
ncbi:hypothetical protein CALVIDRAFT_371507 [Calocera viscosa TUFC12733]|uniref:Uncharacterized protein n=1 Tax=Calocera viscosa (strain TUFC12733) TaxID=1330018 RepID=A0A167GWD6_CALVF|nr:hypothetical protein CALVIDRAFT_371507 [Calocera viscosa TUFC12733]